jgi:polar amino acid transport system substrate-binding protein
MTFPPQEFIENGQQVGSDIEIGNEIARRMGVEAEYIQVGFDGIIAALLSNKCDAIDSGMTDTPERRQQVAFAHYAQVGEQLMVQKGNPSGIQTLDDLSGRAIAVQVGTAPIDRLKAENTSLESQGKDTIKIVTFPKDGDAANALANGQVDAYISDATPVAYYVKQNPDTFEAAGEQFEPSPIGFGLRQEDAQLKAALLEAIAAMYADGTMQKILDTWLIGNTALPPG